MARTKDITPIVRNGTPPGERPGLLKALTPPTIATSASPTTTVSAATLITAGPSRRRADGRQRRADKVGDQERRRPDSRRRDS